MVDIDIHHLTLRIVRHDGWSWGPEPQRLFQSAMRTLPELLARQLAELWDDEADYEIVTPVRITIPVRLHELLTVDATPTGSDSTLENVSLPSLHTRLAQALRSTVLGEHFTPAEMGHAEPRQSRKVPVEQMHVPPGFQRHGTLLRLLLTWYEQGVLAARLELCTLPSLETWCRSMYATGDQAPAGVTSVSPETLTHWLHDFAATLPAPATDRAAMLRRWLVLAVAITHGLGVHPGDAAVQQALQQILPLSICDGDVSPATSALLSRGDGDRSPVISALRLPAQDSQLTENLGKSPPIAPDQRERRPAPQRVQPPPPSSPAVLYEGEVSVASALPFLLLGPLTRLGYLQTLTAVLESAALLPHMPLFATALAYKVLDPPHRGWRRHPTAVPAAATFAALTDALPEPELAAFAEHISAHLSPLDTVLTDVLVTGHNPQQPLLVYGTESPKGLLLVDVEGIFPLAWAEGVEALSPILLRCPASPLLIPQATIDPQLLGQLQSASLCFVTDAPPTRHEQWRPLRHPPSGRWWTNDVSTPASQLIKAAQLLADAAEETAMLWQQLALERPSLPVLPDAALDRTLTLTAAIALGTIAWILWREREPVAPHLTLARFRDLDARVCFSPESVRVRLPLGRRYRDLYEHGLLDDVQDVPWFNGRVLQFSGG
jgi:hypothetical protein